MKNILFFFLLLLTIGANAQKDSTIVFSKPDTLIRTMMVFDKNGSSKKVIYRQIVCSIIKHNEEWICLNSKFIDGNGKPVPKDEISDYDQLQIYRRKK